ncbi:MULTISPECIES: hypothetical protein [Brevibacillus]|jgi:hypothetical protein|uniref:hypothetical protein n=1 Tax=Brevibacillus TaxID=55080 RepID=UPI001167669B|nr:hypothetical protein [Brevibacillus borstelensis]MCC0563332.1 hypothetical protein [Brevibacillus borstelensis]MCM3471343.1 hypothetical protein [Brevibacillus borstelensis]MCM3558602.1 hypothetical protein [Brevibacillus borstelensis]MED1884043.1 hypothetical protein [Brevibacillus borstelensis]MED2010037.1 hypothetical protein [Brevibacillus borstelensis]
MVRTEPIIAVNDVKASSQWYQSLLAFQNSHSNGIFDQLVDTDGTSCFACIIGVIMGIRRY